MYVRWKTLIGLGTVFWISLCLYDVYFVNPATKFLYSDSDEFEWLTQVAQEEIIEEDPYPVKDDIIFPFEGYSFGISLLVWNLFAFVLTFVLCSVGKVSLIYLMEWQARNSKTRQVNIGDAIRTAMAKKVTSSKIPVFTAVTASKSSTTFDDTIDKMDRQTDESSASLISNSSTSIDVNVRLSKSEMSSRAEQQMEKQCAKLRDEMIVIQANSLKEHAALSRKLESVSREKRDLYRQLMITQKENRAAKGQLEELLAEKPLLVRRLECASKEFKMNTKSKKAALAQLEESQVTISSLRQELDKTRHEKQVLENKFKILDAEHINLKERLAKYEVPLHDSFNVKLDDDKDNYEFKQDLVNPETSKDHKKAHLSEISQSQKDVQRVQLRLMNLEKSLDRLKLSNWEKMDENKKLPNFNTQEQNNITTETEEFDNFVASITTKAESPLEGHTSKAVNSMLIGSDNLTDEERRKILDPTESSGDEYSIHSKNYDYFMDREEDPFERVGNLLNYVKRPTKLATDTFETSDKFVNDTTSSPNEDESPDDWEPQPPKRIVSNSPAFQKFLMNMDPPDRTHKKFIS